MRHQGRFVNRQGFTWVPSHALLDETGEEIELSMLQGGTYWRDREWEQGGFPPSAERLVEIGWSAVELPPERRFATLHLLPDHLRVGLGRWVVYGEQPGGFLTALLSNDLVRAVGRADPVSFEALPRLCRFLLNDVPRSCWGSRSQVGLWREARGLAGGGKTTVWPEYVGVELVASPSKAGGDS